MANKLYINPETSITWTETGGDETFTLSSLAADGVRVGAQHDLSTAPRAGVYQWQLVISGMGDTPVVGETIDVYGAEGDGTYIDGNVGSADASGITGALPNLKYLGSAVIQETSATEPIIVSGRFSISQRYFTPVIHNNTADALSTNQNYFILTPIPGEVQ